MMELMDFDEFEPFNKLRKSMEMKGLGEFELFDPARHLSGNEREWLEQDGIEVKVIQLRGLQDKSLAYKNARVFAYVMSENFEQYHFAQCETLKKIRHAKPSTTTLISLRTDDWGKINQAKACPHCLQTLGFHGFDEFRHRKREYSEQVYKDFSRIQYAKEYPMYPIG